LCHNIAPLTTAKEAGAEKMTPNVLRYLWDEHALQSLCADLPVAALLALTVVCIAVLSKGANWLVDGVVHLARRTGMPRIVIGATIVSLGTTSPEAFVSVMAAWMGNPGLALGNGVGSIICDTGMIFGLTCILTTVPMDRYILNRTGWVQFGAALLLVLVSVGMWVLNPEAPVLHRWVGVFFLVLLFAYLYAAYIWSGGKATETTHAEAPDNGEIADIPKSLLLLLGGLVCVILGARVLIPVAAEMALRIGVPDDVIAATMVAFGTSLPELITAIASIRRGHPEITVGNIVGADVLNCLFVIGAAAAAKPLEIPPNFFRFHFPAMLIILISFRVFISMNRSGTFSRWQGVWLFSLYLAYLLLQYV
jgi:cation:H+ antiporter